MSLTLYILFFRLLFGLLYPAYASYKAVKTKNVKEYVKWMMYWIVFAFFTCIETFADIFIAWLPFYYEMKILFVLWLLSPATKGSSILYRKVVHPQLSKREKDIDTYITKASDQGYSALLAFGSRGFSYATNVVLNTAIKGQTKIADHLRKSYSMSDLSGDQIDGNRKFRREDNELDADDEADNRLIEESYQEEMMEKENRSGSDKSPSRSADGDDISRRRRSYVKEPDLDSVEESEEEPQPRKNRKAYSTKEDSPTARRKSVPMPSSYAPKLDNRYSSYPKTGSLSSSSMSAYKRSISLPTRVTPSSSLSSMLYGSTSSSSKLPTSSHAKCPPSPSWRERSARKSFSDKY